MATTAQIKAVQCYRRQIFGSDEEAYRDWLSENFGVRSTKQLTRAQASEAIQLFAGGDQGRRRGKYVGSGEVGSQRHLTQAQANRIDILESLLGWTQNGTRKFIERQTGRPKAVEWLMNFEAKNVIVGMQRILANGDKVRYQQLNNMSNVQLQSMQDAI